MRQRSPSGRGQVNVDADSSLNDTIFNFQKMEDIMIFTRLKLTNLCSFADAELNLSYPRKLVNIPLDGEHLSGRTRFYYRKVCIITGGNASGKTSLGRILLGIQIFLRTKELRPSSFRINEKNSDASLEADFATEDFKHHRIYVRFSAGDTGGITIKEIHYGFVYIAEDDSCARTTAKLNALFDKEPENSSRYHFHYFNKDGSNGIIDAFKNHTFTGGWYYLLSETKESTTGIPGLKKHILEKIMKAFDSSIDSVSEMQETDGAEKKEGLDSVFMIRFKNSDSLVVTSKGEITNSERLSRGTFDAVRLSHFINSIIADHDMFVGRSSLTAPSMTYFLDERMAFAHSELEKIIITLIISKLKSNAQFFYTTHNMDIFELDLPVHSFIFIRKTETQAEFVEASAVIKKNDRSLRRLVERDFFGVSPDTSPVVELL